MAEEWIATHEEQFEKGEQAVFAITIASTEELVGAIGLGIRTEHRRAELGYRVGKPYWNDGYCTEAAAAVVRWGFDVLGLERIYATHFAGNPASGRVMRKLGMKHEGTLRRHIYKWGVPRDMECCGILRRELDEVVTAPRAEASCHDQETQTGGVSLVLSEEEPEDRKAKESRHVQNASGCREARTSGAVL